MRMNIEEQNRKLRALDQSKYYPGYQGNITAYATPDKKIWEQVVQKGRVLRVVKQRYCTQLVIQYRIDCGRSLVRTLYI